MLSSFSHGHGRPPEVLSETERSLQSHGRVVLCQIVRAEGSTPGKMGWKLLARPDGTFVGNLGGGAFEALVKADALAKLRSGRRRRRLRGQALLPDRGGRPRGEPTGMVCGGMAEVFLEVMVAAPVLVICGGGPVGQALARAAALAGFEMPGGGRPRGVPRSGAVPGRRPARRGGRLDTVKHRRGLPRSRCAAASSTSPSSPAAGRPTRRRSRRCSARRPAGLRYLGLMGSRRKLGRVREALADAGFDLSTSPAARAHRSADRRRQPGRDRHLDSGGGHRYTV